MSLPSSNRAAASHRAFGTGGLALDEEPSPPEPSRARQFIGRIFRRSRDNVGGVAAGKPPIPTMQTQGEAYTTPLPTLSMIVLSITMLGEFLSANVSTPFLLFMVGGFGKFTDDAEIAFWTGILVATFFLTQFVTSLLWATVADKHGRRAVLVVSLLGSALTCVLFGTATTLQQAICIRLMQGVFAGAVGVARGSVAFITDSTNEGRAYAILGFCWGFGGVAGAIIGGSFESPAVKWPGVFADKPLFNNYPYLLPCAIAASITLTGSILACFLGPDGGPREGAIRLLPEKIRNNSIPEEESVPPSPTFTEPETPKMVGSIKDRVSQTISGFLSRRTAEFPDVAPPVSQPPVQLETPTPRTRRDDGSAYGYRPAESRQRLNNASSMRTRRKNMLRRKKDGHGSSTGTNDLNFAQRLLMANENAVTNIADLWVAAAMNADYDSDPLADTDSDSDGDDFSDLGEETSPTEGGDFLSPRFSGRPTTIRRYSSKEPSIFSHAGVKTPSAVLNAQEVPVQNDSEIALGRDEGLLRVSRRAGRHRQRRNQEVDEEQPPSLFSQIPVLVIIQYGVLALHTTTQDQVFMSYLVTKYESGGLNLNAGHFAQLIAFMSLAQIAYQFYLYPNIGPPRGRFSHMSMFRIGSFFFIPSYLLVVLYRPLASARSGGNLVLMAALTFSTALRYVGITFAYTAISILLNYMTPPAAVGIANGIAQSIVSLARCFGPVLGGYLWSASTNGNPSGYSLGFIACAIACFLSILQSFLIR